MKKHGLSIILASFLAFVCSMAMAITSPLSEVKSAKAERADRASSEKLALITGNEELLNQTERVIFSKNGETVLSICGNFATERGDSDEERVRNFLLQHGSVFNIARSGDNLSFVKETNGGGIRHFHYRMQAGELPVENSEITVRLGKDGQIRQIDGSFPEIDNFNSEVRLSSAEAVAMAESFLKLEKKRSNTNSEKFISVRNRTASICYRVLIPARKPLGDWEIIIDARSGEEVSRKNLLIFYEGKGSTYVSHPLKCDISVEALPHLIDGTLKGKFADIHNDETANASSSDGVFVYPTHNLHFNEGMMYYLVNRVHDFYAGLGYDRLDFAIKAVVRFDVLYDNAFFSVLENAMYFGDGYRFNDMAREESVCFHEYAHAARHQIVKLKYEGEPGAIDEGQADYFSASLSDDPVIGEYIVNKMSKPWLRNLTDQNRYPENLSGNVHEDGKIWGGALWDLRQALGSRICDKLVLASLYYLVPESNFQHGLNAILLADENNYGGSNRDKILEVFGKRGITTADSGRLAFNQAHLRQMRRFNELQNPVSR